VVNTATLYAGGPAFKSQSGNWLSWLEVFLCFSSDLPDKCWDSTLKSGHDHFLPNPSQFIIHPIISEKALNKLQNHKVSCDLFVISAPVTASLLLLSYVTIYELRPKIQ
jgi:hypothetical protein